MKNIYLTIPLLTLALIATGCAADKTTTGANTNSADTNVNASANVNTNQPTVTNTNVTPTEEGGDVAEAATVTEEGDEYQGWKSYTNDEFGFNLKYPSDWTLAENSQCARLLSPQTVEANNRFIEKNVTASDAPSAGEVVVCNTSNATSFDSWLQANATFSEEISRTESTYQDKRSVTIEAADLQPSKNIYVETDGAVVSIHVSGVRDELKSITDSIIKTISIN